MDSYKIQPYTLERAKELGLNVQSSSSKTYKIEVYDGKFFSKGAPFNQGSIFDFNEDEFIHGCEQAISRVEKDRTNHEGLKLQDQFKYSDLAKQLLSMI